MLGRSLLLESTLPTDECVNRLAANSKQVPGWATWWTWSRDRAFWGSTSSEGFQLQQGRARQLVLAKGRVASEQGRTLVNVVLSFKAWVVPYLVASAVSVAIVGVLVGETYGQPGFVAVALAVAAFGLLSNLGLGLLQQRDLLRTLRRIMDARPVAA